MFTLLIVDDDASARRGLRNCVDWSSLDVEVCGEAMNGLQAIDMINELSPDIVLSDVRMPFMDGIDLCRQLKTSQRKVKIIFISGYDEIEYLKSAVRLGVEDYILKPVNVDELENVVRNTIMKILEEQRIANLHSNMKQKLKESMPLLREHFFINLLKETEKASVTELKQRLNYLEIPLPVESPYELLLIKLYCEHLSEYDKHVLTIKLNDFMCTFIANQKITGQVLQTDSDEFTIILPILPKQEIVSDICNLLADNLVKSIRELFNVDISISIGKESNNLVNISESYMVAKEALSQAYYEGKNTVLVSNAQAYTTDNSMFWDDEQAMIGALKACDSSHVATLSEELYAIISQKNVDIEYIHALYRRILTAVVTMLHENGMVRHPLLERATILMGEIIRMPTLQICHQEIEAYLLMVCSAINKTRESSREIIIKQIKEVISDKLSENLTIQDIANTVRYSSAYISSIFKHETGQTINEYITACRMKKAQELMKDPTLKLYLIAEMVGYTDTKYFSRLFRKYIGINPSDYRS